MEYRIKLNKKQEKFLDLYLQLFPLRKEHKRKDYPGIIAKNYINSMMKRKNEFLGRYKDKFGEEFDDGGLLD